MRINYVSNSAKNSINNYNRNKILHANFKGLNQDYVQISTKQNQNLSFGNSKQDFAMDELCERLDFLIKYDSGKYSSINKMWDTSFPDWETVKQHIKENGINAKYHYSYRYDPNNKSLWDTPIGFAAKCNDTDLVLKMYDAGAKLTKVNSANDNVLSFANPRTLSILASGLRERGIDIKNLITEKTIKNLLYSDALPREYKEGLTEIKNNQKNISRDTLFKAVHSLVSAIKYPGSYRRISPDENLLLLLSHVQSEQPKDFNDVLAYLVQSIAG